VRAAQRGDAIALHDLLDVVTPYVERLCGPIALRDAPDATQETLIVVEAIRVARSASRATPANLPDLPTPGDPELAADIADVLNRLAPEHRAVLVLRDLEGFDEQRASELLQIPAGTVRSRLFRARRSFRKAWLTDRSAP
jgi:RNA polymerase sigma-70 factor (ECF subfamily)